MVPAYSKIPVEVQFKPIAEGYFKDILHIRSDTETSRVAQLMILAGRTGSSILSIDNQAVLSGYRLEQNYPNPFNPVTTIKYQIPLTEWVTLKVYDALGSEIITLVNKEKHAGINKIEFDGRLLSSGINFYRFQTE